MRKLVPKHFTIEISGNIQEYVKQIKQKKRTKRNALPLEEMARSHVNQVDELKNFGEDGGNHRVEGAMNDDIDYMSDNTQTNSQGSQQSNVMNSEDYRDYAFDTTDTDKYNEDDDLLRRYYTHPVRRSANSDFDSFSDIMRLVADQGDSEDPFVKRLHYGNDNGLMNDEVNDENDIDEFNSQYDEYDEY